LGGWGGFRVWSLQWLSEAVKNRKCRGRAVWEDKGQAMRLWEFLRNENLKKIEVKQRLLRRIEQVTSSLGTTGHLRKWTAELGAFI